MEIFASAGMLEVTFQICWPVCFYFHGGGWEKLLGAVIMCGKLDVLRDERLRLVIEPAIYVPDYGWRVRGLDEGDYIFL
ncbi:hypothetical protein M9X92_011395 [Pyricularia oryzae]|nr:hypothetical protein M9X92_011395 [Pyricularia oryzae]